MTSSPAEPTHRLRSLVTRLLADPMASVYLIIVAVSLLVALGSLMWLSASSVYSESIYNDPYTIFIHQLVFLALGIVAGWWCAMRSPGALKTLGWVLMVLALVLMLAVFIPGLGSDAGKGHLAWLKLGSLTLQPSELSKLALVVWSAAVASAKEKVLDRPKQLAFPLLVGCALVLLCVLAEKDLGTALVIGGFILTMLWIIGLPPRMMLALLAAAVALVAVLVLTSPNRMLRVMAYLSGTGGDPNASQQPLDSVFGLATGGWWGVGLGASRQKWGGLYDGAQNDFVFSVLGEELGLMGTLTLLLLLALLIYAGMRVAQRSDTIFGRVAATGITTWLALQSLVNIGVAMQILPVIGVPLPFISVGGTALVSNLMAAGVLVALARDEPAARAQRRNRPRRPRTRGGQRPRKMVTTAP